MTESAPGTASPRMRSQDWFAAPGKDGHMHRSWMFNQGLPDDAFDGRPIIGICNTWSELTPCNAHLRELADRVKRGVLEAGGVPLEFPVLSCGESNMRPTAMLYRNLASMDVEETIRANPIDGVVGLVGCDKTTPSVVMGAASTDIPTMIVSGGPMLNGKFRGEDIGSGTAVWRFAEAVRAGQMTDRDFREAERGMARSAGHCMTMGTASTMASMVEALGLSLPHNAATPAVDAGRGLLAQLTGRRIVGLVKEQVRISQILTSYAFENAIRTCAAIGGSTNAVIHLLAIAGRVGVDLTLDDWDRLGRDVPTIVDLQPSGRYLMEEFHYAGGLPGVLRRLGETGLLHRDALTVTGATLWSNVESAPVHDTTVIRDPQDPSVGHGGIAVLRGNVAPNGAVIKPSAASPELLIHRGPAVVFDSIEEYRSRIDSPDLDVTPDSVLVLRNCGPKGYPGMAEVGNMGLPAKLLREGVTDMVRISDARMSGTAFGTVVLHAAPEATAGGPISLVRDGDLIELDVPRRILRVDLTDEELSARASERATSQRPSAGGYIGLYVETVMGADTGADLDFLVGSRGCETPRPSH